MLIEADISEDVCTRFYHSTVLSSRTFYTAVTVHMIAHIVFSKTRQYSVLYNTVKFFV